MKCLRPLPSLTSPTWSPSSISAFSSCLSFLLSQSQMCGPSPVKAVDTRCYNTYFMLLTSFLVHCIFSLNAYHTYFETHTQSSYLFALKAASNPWVGKIPWRRERLPTPLFWPREFLGLCIVHGVAKSRTWPSYFWASLIAQLVKNPPAMQETRFDSWVGKIPWRRERLPTPVFLSFPCGSAVKNLPAMWET